MFVLGYLCIGLLLCLLEPSFQLLDRNFLMGFNYSLIRFINC